MNLTSLQKKIYEVLASTKYKVFDSINKDVAYPFIRIGITNVVNIKNKSNNSYKVQQYIHIFSDYNGQKEIKEISQEIIDILLNANLSFENTQAITNLNTLQILEDKENTGAGSQNDVGTFFHAIIILDLQLFEN